MRPEVEVAEYLAALVSMALPARTKHADVEQGTFEGEKSKGSGGLNGATSHQGGT